MACLRQESWKLACVGRKVLTVKGMQTARVWAMRALGVLNLFFSGIGLCYFAWQLWRIGKPVNRLSPPIWAWAVFTVLSIMSLALVACLIRLGIRLLNRDDGAIRPLSIVFSAEILYFFASIVLFWLVIPSYAPTMRTMSVGFFDSAQGALDPQVVTGYPLLGLLATLFLQRRRNGVSESL